MAVPMRQQGVSPRLRTVDDGGSIAVYVEYLTALELSPTTISLYSNAVERWITYAIDEGFDPLTAEALKLAEYAQELPNTATSKRLHRVALRHWFESMGRTDAPLKSIRMPLKKRRLKGGTGTYRGIDPCSRGGRSVA